MNDKVKMPVDGSGTKMNPADRNGELASRRGGDKQTGESGGGPYPNPDSGKQDGGKGGDFKGGQSEQAYYGHGQLGEQDVEGDNSNAPSERE